MVEPCKLSPDHDVSAFACGKPNLNRFLKRDALRFQQAQGSLTWVLLEKDRVIAYYTSTVGTVEIDEAPSSIGTGIKPYKIPIFLIGRLAVDIKWQKKGIGKSLLAHAIGMALEIAERTGLKAVVVDALDEEAREYYLKFGFILASIDDFRLYLSLEDIKQNL